MNRKFPAALSLACALSLATLPAVLMPTLALAAEPATTTATGNTILTFWWGQYVLALSNAFMEAAAPIIVAFVLGFIGKNYPLMKSFISEKVVEDQVAKFVAYAENAEAGVLKGAHLDVDVGRSVLGTTVARALECANVNVLARKAVKWAGGPEAIAKKVFRRLNLASTASAENVLVPILRQIEEGTLLPEKIATAKVVPIAPTEAVPKVVPKPVPKVALNVTRAPVGHH